MIVICVIGMLTKMIWCLKAVESKNKISTQKTKSKNKKGVPGFVEVSILLGVFRPIYGPGPGPGDGGGGGTLPASPTPQPTCPGRKYPVRVTPHSDWYWYWYPWYWYWYPWYN